MYLDEAALDRAAALIAAAQYPVFVLGLQCHGAGEAEWLRALAESVPAPVLTTDQAKGVLPEAHPLVLGILGDSAIEPAVLGRADLIVTIGLDPMELPRAWPYQVPVVHLASAAHPGHPFVPAVAVIGGICEIVEELAPRLRQKTRANWDVALLDRLKCA